MRIGKFVLFLAIAGCDCNKTRAQIEASHVMIATVLATPEISLRPESIAGFHFDAGAFFDGGIPSFDGGCPFDGGCAFDGGQLPVSFDGGAVALAPQTALFAFFGTREGDGLSSAPKAVEDATMKVTNGAATWMLKAQGSGAHALTTQDDATLTYDAGATYTFTATSMNVEYEGEVVDTPEVERITQLHPPEGFIDIAAGTDVTLTRPDPPPGEQRELAFITVIPVSGSGQQGNPTWSNIPTQDDPIQFLKLVAAPGEWRKTVVVIPGATAFPEPDKNYVILMQSAKLGFASSSNLFIGSAMIAGVADVGIVKTRP